MAKQKPTTQPKLTWTAKTETEPGVVTVRCNGLQNGGDQWFLLRSDAHWDNPDSDRALMKSHLEQAKERGAGIIDCGDLFCAMQGKYDRRSDKSKCRPEHQSGDYLDKLVNTAAEWHQPYAHLWAAQYYGNHETSILSHHETNLIERWTQSMRDKTNAPMPIVGYSGWVRFMFQITSTQSKVVKLWAIHGYGGGGPVTKDMIQRSRMLSYVEGADIMMSGHTHDQWVTKDQKITCNNRGFIEQKSVTVLKLPTYKDEYKKGAGGYHIEKGRPPKPVGAYWLRFYREHKKDSDTNGYMVRHEIREAI